LRGLQRRLALGSLDAGQQMCLEAQRPEVRFWPELEIDVGPFVQIADADGRTSASIKSRRARRPSVGVDGDLDSGVLGSRILRAGPCGRDAEAVAAVRPVQLADLGRVTEGLVGHDVRSHLISIPGRRRERLLACGEECAA